MLLVSPTCAISGRDGRRGEQAIRISSGDDFARAAEHEVNRLRGRGFNLIAPRAVDFYLQTTYAGIVPAVRVGGISRGLHAVDLDCDVVGIGRHAGQVEDAVRYLSRDLRQ